jgi:branched-chain amino acid transport system substrate-binding protein
VVSPLGRRAFLALVASLAAHRAGANAGSALRLGLVTSQGPLGEAIQRGARLGLAEAELFAKMFGTRVELVERANVADDQALSTALALFREERVAAVIGGASAAAAEALQKASREASGLFLNVGAIGGRLRGELSDRRTLHVHPGVATLVDAAGLWLIEQGRRTRWGLLVAESAFGAEVESRATSLASGRGAQVVHRASLSRSFADWPRTVGRLRAAQADAVLVGLEPDATRAFLDACRAAGFAGEPAVVTSDPQFALEAERSALGGVWPLVWHKSLERYSARELNGRFRRRFEQALDGAAWAAWAAVKIVSEAAVRAGSLEIGPLLDFVETRLAFDGHKGAALSFRESDRELAQPLYIGRARPGTGADGSGGMEIVAEVSRARLDAVAQGRQAGA